MYKAEIGDIVTWTDEGGRHHIGRVAAATEWPAGTPARQVIVAAPDGDHRVAPEHLKVVRPNFVQETWNALGEQGDNPWIKQSPGGR